MRFWLRCFVICAAFLFSQSCTASFEEVQSKTADHFDYVIIGGGTAGLVIASRLSENPNTTVAVIEAGNFERNNPNVTNTTVLGRAANTNVDWQYKSLPQTFVGNKSLIWSAGKGLGGSSLINGMTYMRPSSSQIDLWPSLGLELDWTTLFNNSRYGEHFQPPSAALTALGACYEQADHGFAGPLATCISPHMTNGNLHDVLNTTFKNAGIPPRCEFNGGDLRGFGVQMVTQDGHADVREDAARAYYYPVMDRQNLVIMVNTTATRILWSDNDSGESAIAAGVEVISQSGDASTVHAGREVVLSTGSIKSPAILENSGVGNPAILIQQAVDVKVNLPSVGENLQDQMIMIVLATSLQNYSGFPPFVAHTSMHDLFGSDTMSVYEAAVAELPSYAATIARQNGGASSAATQERLLKTQLDLLLRSNTPTSEIAPGAFGTFIGGAFWPLQPLSRGSVHINSKNRTATPAIDAKFLQLDFDKKVAIATARFVRNLFLSAPLADIVNSSTLSPSLELIPEDANDDVWLGWIQTNASVSPNYHPLGTCAMLPRDMGGVVDNDFRVYGTGNVRVVDLSIVPLQVAGHSTALLYGIAEWAARKLRS